LKSLERTINDKTQHSDVWNATAKSGTSTRRIVGGFCNSMWAVAVHGGAGVVSKNIDSGPYVEGLDSALSEILPANFIRFFYSFYFQVVE
jgi:hypothetical protein